MKTQQNIQTIQQMYADFGQGNVPGILSAVADNFAWDHAGRVTDTPFAGQYQGKDGLLRFFQSMNEAGEVVKWQVDSVDGVDDNVYALGKFGIKSRATGKIGENDWAMVFTFDGSKLVAGRVFVDTLAMAETFS